MFDMFKLSIMQFYIGVEFVYLLDGIMLVQKAYVVTMLERLNTKDFYYIVTPMEEGLQLNLNMEIVLIDPSYYQCFMGSLMWLIHTWLELCYVATMLSR